MGTCIPCGKPADQSAEKPKPTPKSAELHLRKTGNTPKDEIPEKDHAHEEHAKMNPPIIESGKEKTISASLAETASPKTLVDMQRQLSNPIDSDEYPDYEIESLIGRGAYAKVYRAIHKPTKTRVAIKHQFDIFDDIITAKRILREVCILKEMKHQSIVKLYDVFIPKESKESYNSICLVFELAVTSMDKLIRSGMMLESSQIQSIMYNILVGLNHIQSAGVLHRDLKPGNILLYNDCSVRICDFGLARTVSLAVRRCSISNVTSLGKHYVKTKVSGNNINLISVLKDATKNESPPMSPRNVKKIKKLENANRKLTMHVATRWYRAPEIILKQEFYGPEVDIWALGCIFAELLSIEKGSIDSPSRRKPLFPGDSCMGLSPKAGNVYDETKTESAQDQLQVILSVLGKPSEYDISLISDPSIVKALEELPNIERKSFHEMYPKASDEAIDLLEKMLVFNPMNRIKTKEILAHKYFEDIKDSSKEKKADFKLNLEVDKAQEIDREKLIELFKKEIEYYEKKKLKGKLFEDVSSDSGSESNLEDTVKKESQIME